MTGTVGITPLLLTAMAPKLATNVARTANRNQTDTEDLEALAAMGTLGDVPTSEDRWKVTVDMARLCQLARQILPTHHQGRLYSTG